MVCVSALWCLSQHLSSYLGFSYPGRGVSLHSCSSKAQPLLLTLAEVTPLDLEHGVAPLSPPAPAQPPLLGCGVAPLGHHLWCQTWGCSSQLSPLTSDVGELLLAATPLAWGPPGFCPWPRTWGSSSWPCSVLLTLRSLYKSSEIRSLI